MFTPKQQKNLSQPIHPARVKKLQGNDYIESWDAINCANQIFGYGGWDSEIISLECVDEQPGSREGSVTVTYLCQVRLVVRDEDGNQLVRTEVGEGDAINQPKRGAAHALAAKSAASDARKRCLMTLGPQFGLSLYNEHRELSEKFCTFVQQHVEKVGGEVVLAVLQSFGYDHETDVHPLDKPSMQAIMKALVETAAREAA